MKRFSFTVAPFATVLLAVLAWHSSVFASITVPATANPTLAGMPDGSPGPGTGPPLYYYYDYAPANSPVQVTGVPIVPGIGLLFSATGSATVQWDWPPSSWAGPNGYSYPVLAGGGVPGPPFTTWPIRAPAAPSGSLVGVFLDDNSPIGLPAPAALDFSSSGNVPGGLFYSTLSPGLRQIFFIGDGHNAVSAYSGIPQQVIVPTGATRLYLGYGDYGQAANNAGSFSVDVSAVPEPSTIFIWSLLGSIAIGIGWWRRRKAG